MVGAHLAQITDLADVITDPVSIHINIHLNLAGMLSGNPECLNNRAGVCSPPTPGLIRSQAELSA